MTDKNAISHQIFVMAIQENPSKAYPSIVAHHQVALEYSTISQKVIHSFETNIFRLSNLLKRFLLTSLIYRNDYRTFYKIMSQKGNLGYM